MGETTVVDEVTRRTLDWAAAMKEWLNRYENHINDLVTKKDIDKPPRW